MKRACLLLLLSLWLPGVAAAGDAETGTRVAEWRRMAEWRHGLWQVAGGAYSNPAVNQWRMRGSVTSVAAGVSGRHDRGERDPRYGSSSVMTGGGAETYTKYRSSTLWGHGRYATGRRSDVVWNESSDYDIVYPYVLADSVGGDINCERYDFGGGYAGCDGRVAWGVEASYLATLEYRGVDPRPRNVAGKLEVAAGLLMRVVSDSYAGVSVRFRKYKQTSEVAFKSEMGVDKIFHLTGPAAHYRRFAGTAMSTYYNGYGFGLSADFYPASRRGLFVSCGVGRFGFDNILTDLNKLPLASLTLGTVRGTAGYLCPGDSRYWGVAASFVTARRRGRENIFGDASAGVYRAIASLDMYAAGLTSASVCWKGGRSVGRSAVGALTATAGWSRSVAGYADPSRYSRVNVFSLGLGAEADADLGRGWQIGGDCRLDAGSPFDCNLEMAAGHDEELSGLERTERRAHEIASMRRVVTSARIEIGRTVARRYVVQLGVEWSRTVSRDGTGNDCFGGKIGVWF